MFCDTSKTFFRSTAGQDCQNTKKPAATLLAESLRSFLDKSGKGKEERGRKKAESGKRKAESGKRKAESGKRKEERGSRKVSQNMVSSSEPSVNQTLNLRSIKCFRIA